MVDPRLPRGTGEVLPAAATIRAGRPHLPSVRAYARSWAAGTRRMSRTGTAGRLDHTAATAEQAARLTGVRAAAAGARAWRPSSRCLTWQSRPRRARTGRIPSRAATCPAGPGSAAARIHVSGYLDDGAVDAHLAAADACVCLRWPTALESSASWLRCLAAGRPTIFRDREDVRPEGLRATGSSNARPRWR